MSTPYELTGRTRQKARTRAAMLTATRELLAEGVTPSVEQAADRAGVSRTTAYRYFSNQRELMVACFPLLEEKSLLGPDPPADPEVRLDSVTATIGRQILQHEPELRAALRLSLEASREAPLLRRGRALGWIEDALSPLQDRLSRARVRRLALAIRATVGIEAFVWLTDVGGVSGEDAVELMRSSARVLLRDATAGDPAGGPGRPQRTR